MVLAHTPPPQEKKENSVDRGLATPLEQFTNTPRDYQPTHNVNRGRDTLRTSAEIEEINKNAVVSQAKVEAC